MEIERKYAIRELPENLSQYRHLKIEQGYLCSNPILRIRKSNDDYYLTYKAKIQTEGEKGETPIVNNEVELPLTEDAYLHLRNKVDGNSVYKTRYLIPLQDGLTAELDVFEQTLQGLILAEVEFPSIEASFDFKPPTWFDRDVSSDKRLSNRYLSQLTSPPILKK